VIIIGDAFSCRLPLVLAAAVGTRRDIRRRVTEIRIGVVVIVDDPRCTVQTRVVD
jgi:hypothetical protein